MKKYLTFSRRSFISTASVLAVGGSILSFRRPDELLSVSKTGKRHLWDELNPEEIKLIEQSQRAQNIVKIEGMSCAQKVLLSTIRSFDKPDELVNFAASFGGGIKREDLCGMLTGGFMSIGLASDILFEDKEKRTLFVNEATAEYWNWWEELAPIHCSKLKPRYSPDREKYNLMLQRVALKMDELFSV